MTKAGRLSSSRIYRPIKTAQLFKKIVKIWISSAQKNEHKWPINMKKCPPSLSNQRNKFYKSSFPVIIQFTNTLSSNLQFWEFNIAQRNIKGHNLCGEWYRSGNLKPYLYSQLAISLLERYLLERNHFCTNVIIF